eukprot:14670707-Alexandrium_andersonii.AAC.1
MLRLQLILRFYAFLENLRPTQVEPESQDSEIRRVLCLRAPRHDKCGRAQMPKSARTQILRILDLSAPRFPNLSAPKFSELGAPSSQGLAGPCWTKPRCWQWWWRWRWR